MNEDYFGGGEITIRSPPFIQSINAWVLDIFDYSTLRLFPLYFIILFSLSIYYSARRLVQNNYYAYIGVLMSLITPAFLIISSRFSLQQDLPFLAFLAFAFLTFIKNINNLRWKSSDFVNFTIALSLLALTREVGLIISWSILMMFIAFKFSTNTKIKNFFLVLVFIPLFSLSFYDIYSTGITTLILLRIITLLSANVVLFFISPRIKEFTKFDNMYKPLLSFLVLAIPLSFIISNIVFINGLYPTLLFSSDFASSVQEYRTIFDIPNKLVQSLSENLSQIPRIDLLFISSALGSIFIFFKFYGFKVIVQRLREGKKNYFPLVLFLIVMVVVWSYLLTSNFTEAGVRHISYFIPFLTLTIIIGIDRRSTLIKLYILLLIAFSFYYFMHFDIEATSQNDRFYALWIDPLKNAFIDLMDLVIGAAFFVGYFVLKRIEKFVGEKSLEKYLIFGFPLIGTIFILSLLTLDIRITSFEPNDSVYSRTWENNVFDVIDFLRIADSGNVLSVRAPAISYFTNRTNYDIFNPHVFNKIALPIFNSSSISSIEDKVNKLNISYFVFPNINNPSYNVMENLEENYNIKKKLKYSSQIMEIPLMNYTIYKFNGNRTFSIDLLDEKLEWMPIDVKLLNFNPTLLILSETNSTGPQYNRIYLNTTLPIDNRATLLKLNYSSESVYGNASIFYEVRDFLNQEILYSEYLGNTLGKSTEKILLLPKEISGREIEMRFYILNHEPGKHYLRINEASLTYP